MNANTPPLPTTRQVAARGGALGQQAQHLIRTNEYRLATLLLLLRLLAWKRYGVALAPEEWHQPAASVHFNQGLEHLYRR